MKTLFVLLAVFSTFSVSAQDAAPTRAGLCMDQYNNAFRGIIMERNLWDNSGTKQTDVQTKKLNDYLADFNSATEIKGISDVPRNSFQKNSTVWRCSIVTNGFVSTVEIEDTGYRTIPKSKISEELVADFKLNVKKIMGESVRNFTDKDVEDGVARQRKFNDENKLRELQGRPKVY